MIRKRLSLQLMVVLLVVTLVPLAGVGWLTFHLIERSMIRQVEASQDQLARAAGALVKDYLKDATVKLKNIVRLIQKDSSLLQQKRLEDQVDPPGILFEVTVRKVLGEGVDVVAQAQQKAYFDEQLANKFQNSRSFNPKVKQYVQNWTLSDPIISEPNRGNEYWAPTQDNIGTFNGLPISVPAGPDVLTSVVDLKPLAQLLSSVAGPGSAELKLIDRKGETLAQAGTIGALPAFSRSLALDHAGWQISIAQSQASVLGPLWEAQSRALLGFAVAAALALGMAGLFGSRILSPVRTLARTADRLARGDYAARTGIARPDEIGQLAAAFDRMAEAVQELDLLKGEFVAHVSHELRTPLTSAKMALANVQEGISGTDSLGRVQQDLDRLIRMVNELLDVARIEAGIPLARQATDLGELVRSSVETLRPLARVPLEVAGSGGTVDVDRARVQQIVVNLVDNALKYARSRVDVTVAGREVRVTDDGPGVPAEHRDRIFEKFAKVEAGPKPPGAGLGLSIARKLAQLHGGSLVCEGNSFLLRL